MDDWKIVDEYRGMVRKKVARLFSKNYKHPPCKPDVNNSWFIVRSPRLCIWRGIACTGGFHGFCVSERSYGFE